MDMERIKKYLRLYGWQAAVIVLGLLLVCSPDTASAIIAKVIGWGLMLTGAVALIMALTGLAFRRVSSLVWAVLALGVGIFIVSFPLVLAEALGRFFGIFLTIQGVNNVRSALQRKQADLPWQSGMITAAVTLGAGIVLALLPMALSRIILNLCGLVLMVIGTVNILASWREQKAIDQGHRRPDIIDADE